MSYAKVKSPSSPRNQNNILLGDSGDESDSGFVASTLSADYRSKPAANTAPTAFTAVPTTASPSPFVNSKMDGLKPNTGTSINPQMDTLDESVGETIKRDLNNIGEKLRQVLIPRSSGAANSILEDWDLWGPLLFCLLLASILGLAKPKEAENLFASVFVLVWCGAGVVTLNGQLLGGKLTFFQSVCVLGYCLFPLVIGSILCLVVPIGFLKPLMLTAVFLWACRAATGFLTMDGFEKRRLLAVYPICLFYFIIGWLILVSTTSLSTGSSSPAPAPASASGGSAASNTTG